MKKKISIIVLGLITALVSVAQQSTDELQANYPDSVVLKTDNKKEIIFSFERMSTKKSYLSNMLWKSILNVMETAVKRNDLEEGIQVTYQTVIVGESEQAKVEVTEIETEKSTFLIGGDETREYLSSRIEFLIIQPELLVSFSLNQLDELEEVKNLNIESVWTQVENKYEEQGNKNLYFGTGEVRYGEAFIKQIKANKKRLDNLEITIVGVGLGYYRDRFVPDIGTKLAINMYDRLGGDWMQFGAMYTQQYFFSRTETSDFDLDINGWLTGFWKMNLGKQTFGVGIGGLIHREGDFYQGSTWKLSLYNQGENSRLTFSPEVVFTNDFKQAFPALRFGLSF